MDAETQKKLLNAQGLRKDAAALRQKIEELYSESNEHAMVLKTLKDMDSKRRCHKLVHSVLVERTVGEVRPEVQENKEKLDRLIEQFKKQYSEKELEATKIIKEVENSIADMDTAQKEQLHKEIQAANQAM